MKTICSVNSEHKTTDPLYCSICGAKVIQSSSTDDISPDQANSNAAIPVTKSAAGADSVTAVCPDCNTKRTNFAIKHCPVCRYNFETKAYNRFKTTIDLRTKAGAAAAKAINPTLAKTQKEDVAVGASQGSGKLANQRWEILVVVDPSIYQPADPTSKAPNEADRVFHLETAECLVGRKSESRKIYPDVCLNDPGVSHRHCKFLKDKDENFQLLDVGSANGTTVNDEIIAAGVKTLLRHGDQITLGCWTRITVQLATIE